MLRSWVEKSRIKSAINDEDRKKRMAALMSGDIDASLRNTRTEAPHKAGTAHFPAMSGSKASFVSTVRGSARSEIQRANTVHTSAPAQGDRENAVPALSRQPSASILEDLATLGAGDGMSLGSSVMPPPAPFVRQNSLKIAPSGGIDGSAIPSVRTPRVSFEQHDNSQSTGEVKMAHEASVAPVTAQRAPALLDVSLFRIKCL